MFLKFSFWNSRQRYVLGDGAMHKLSQANVLIVGLGGVGVEVGKSNNSLNIFKSAQKSFY